jgi:ABC-type nitrate/sulfonate/bicarbonate transport system substrate-binding protein
MRARRAIAIVALVVVALVSPVTATAQLQKIKVTLPAADEGLDVEIVTVAGGGSLQALIARDAQFTVAPATYQIEAYLKGALRGHGRGRDVNRPACSRCCAGS